MYILVILPKLFTFHSHLASLYASTDDFDSNAAGTFFSHINIPELSHDPKSLLEKPIMPGDVANAIKELKREGRS